MHNITQHIHRNRNLHVIEYDDCESMDRPIALSCNVYGSSDASSHDATRPIEATGSGDKAIVPLHHALQVTPLFHPHLHCHLTVAAINK
jgi:hypothetical protein